jgi:3-oxoacyl-[acyl-carrier protein] reductase
MNLDGTARPFEGKTVLVTGAAGPGIGSACALAFAARGATVIVSDRSAARAESTAERIASETGSVVIPLTMDVSREDSTDPAIKSVLEQVGSIDILVNNAAVVEMAPLAETTLESWQRVIDVCLTGTFLTTRACLPSMVAQGSGSIINISSAAAWRGPGDGQAPYSAAKAGVLGFMRSVASEYGPSGIRVNAVAPGFVPNHKVKEMFGDEYIARTAQATPLNRAATPEDIAGSVLFLASEQSSFITGEAINVTGGFYYHA